ncbi:hypothetical protein KP509_30G064200 [Ceratopteris richardii]|uniref:Large ribosomal subunit protein bL33c n=1 Tax=Ceratopteris richardii TaxID=49495 RepID=A0A8T2R457_CERRI|nr:hypothetical protein KP509_30G064200 [Ceratopteris richardii]
MRITIALGCQKYTQKERDNKSIEGILRYTTHKNYRNTPTRLELKKYCSYCHKHTRSLSIHSNETIDYKNISLLRRFVSEQGKILSRRMKRSTLKQQHSVATAVKRARILALLPFSNNEI